MFSFRPFPSAFRDDDPLDTWEPFLREDDLPAMPVSTTAVATNDGPSPTGSVAPLPPTHGCDQHLAVG